MMSARRTRPTLQHLEGRRLLSGTIFQTGFEAGETMPTWSDTVDWSNNVSGYVAPLTRMESSVRTGERAHAGNSALMFSGKDDSSSSSYSYNKVFDVNLVISTDTVLSYWIFPEQGNGRFVAIDLIFTDGGNLRDSGVVDTHTVRMHPQYQGEGNSLRVNQWNQVQANIGTLAGRTIDRILVAYDQPANAGQFRGYIDDIRIGGGSADSGDGLRAVYYDNADFTGAQVSRVDPTVNFDWGSGSPNGRLGADTFSVRWVGRVKPMFSETYTFYTQTDDGVRLWVNGQQLVNDWTLHGTTERSGTITLQANSLYDIRMEYFEQGGGAVAKLLWSSASTPKQAIPQSRLFSLDGLRTVGKYLRTADGRTVRLNGVNVPSLEWSNAGENVLQSVGVAIDSWKSNCIRLPLAQDRWFGYAGQSDGGASYKAIVDDVVRVVREKGAYVVLDLHWSDTGRWGQYISQHAMPDDNSTTFWNDVAARYANDPYVLFDLYNEPRNVSWDVWKNGGNVTENINGTNVSYHTPGLQSLTNTVRNTSAKNLVVVGGLDWGYDLRGVLNGYEIVDGTGNGIVYDTHVYPWKGDWDGNFGNVANTYPVLVGEVGHTNESQYESPGTWCPRILNYIDSKGMSATGWSFHPNASPSMISDWNYTPTTYWGTYAKDWLART